MGSPYMSLLYTHSNFGQFTNKSCNNHLFYFFLITLLYTISSKIPHLNIRMLRIHFFK